jgi:hypothetical protein
MTRLQKLLVIAELPKRRSSAAEDRPGKSHA